YSTPRSRPPIKATAVRKAECGSWERGHEGVVLRTAAARALDIVGRRRRRRFDRAMDVRAQSRAEPIELAAYGRREQTALARRPRPARRRSIAELGRRFGAGTRADARGRHRYDGAAARRLVVAHAAERPERHRRYVPGCVVRRARLVAHDAARYVR